MVLAFRLPCFRLEQVRLVIPLKPRHIFYRAGRQEVLHQEGLYSRISWESMIRIVGGL